MVDAEKRKKVIRGLKAHCVTWKKENFADCITNPDMCPYRRCNSPGCTAALAADALALLEAQKPVITTNAYGKKFYKCANCGRDFELDFVNPRRVRVCAFCGKPVLWDD